MCASSSFFMQNAYYPEGAKYLLIHQGPTKLFGQLTPSELPYASIDLPDKYTVFAHQIDNKQPPLLLAVPAKKRLLSTFLVRPTRGYLLSIFASGSDEPRLQEAAETYLKNGNGTLLDAIFASDSDIFNTKKYRRVTEIEYLSVVPTEIKRREHLVQRLRETVIPGPQVHVPDLRRPRLPKTPFSAYGVAADGPCKLHSKRHPCRG